MESGTLRCSSVQQQKRGALAKQTAGTKAEVVEYRPPRPANALRFHELQDTTTHHCLLESLQTHPGPSEVSVSRTEWMNVHKETL